MRPITNEDIKVLGRIVNISTENVVADASQVYDSNLHKDQQWLNDYFDSKTGNATTSKYGIVRLAASKNDPDNNDVPTIKILRDAINDAIAFILEDPGNSLLDNLNSIKELADALNNDPSFWTWVRDQLALKADKSAFDTLVGRVDNLNQRVTALEECCQQMHEYVNEFSVTWNQARGGNHVTITPGYVRIGNSVVEINMDPNYVWEVDTTNASQLHTLLLNCMDGDYDSFTITNVTRQAGFVNGMTLNFVGVRSNITINGNVYKLGTITARVTGGTVSPTSQMWQAPAGGSRILTFGVTASSGYTTAGVTTWNIKDSSNVTVFTGSLDNHNSTASISVTVSDANTGLSCFQDYTLDITLPELPSATIIWDYDSSRVNTSNLPASVRFGQTVTTTVTPKTQCIINHIIGLLFISGSSWSDVLGSGNSSDGIFSYNENTGQISITYNQDLLYYFDHFTQNPYETSVKIVVAAAKYYTGVVNYDHAQVESTEDTFEMSAGASSHGLRITPKTGYQIDNVTVTAGGVDITSQTPGSGVAVYDSSTGMLNIYNPVNGNIVVNVTSSATSTTPTYGTVTISPDHGTASPATCQADGTSHTITITPAAGYTTTGMTATSNNNDVSVSVSGNTITVTGTSSNNATITVTVPAESVTPTYTAVITVNPSYACDGVNEPITLGSSWSHTFDIPEYFDSSSYSITSGSERTRSDSNRPAYVYVSDTITMAGGGSITRNGNTFSTSNVTGDITGTITFELDPDVIYGHFVHGTVGGYEQHVSESDPTLYVNTLLTGKVGDKLRVTHIDSGYTLTGSTIRANRNPHFENGVWTSGANQIDIDAVANNLSWDATTGEVTVVKPFFYVLELAYFQIVLKIDTANPPASIEGYMQFLSGSTQEDNAGISGSLQGVAYGQTYTSPTNKIKPLNGWILDTTKGTNGISVINKITYQPMSFTVGAPGSGQEYTITVPNVVAPYYVGIHVKQGS